MSKILKNNFFWLGIILVSGFLLRLYALLKGGSFGFDEMFSTHFAQYNLQEMWHLLIYETNPPLHTFFLHFWIKFFGPSEIAVRSASVLFSLITIIVVYVLGKRMFNKQVGLMAAFLMGFSSFQIYYSIEARTYALLQLLACLSLYYFWQILKEDRKRDWLFYFIFTLLLSLSHLFAWLVIISQNLFVLILYIKKKKEKNFLLKWLMVEFLVVAVFLTWFVPSFLAKLDLTSLNGWYFRYPMVNLSYFIIFLVFLIAGNNLLLIEVLVALFSLVLLISSFANISKEKGFLKLKLDLNLANGFLLLLMIISLIPLLLFSLSVAKYYIFLAPVFYLLFSYGLSKLSLNRLIKISIIILLIASMLAATFDYIGQTGFDWEEVARFVEKTEKASDLIIVHVFPDILPFKNYYQGQSQAVGFYPLGDEDSEELRIIKKNWQQIVDEQNVEKLSELTGDYNRVFLIQTSSLLNSGNYVFNWFLYNSWRLVKKDGLEDFDFIKIFLFEKIK